MADTTIIPSGDGFLGMGGMGGGGGLIGGLILGSLLRNNGGLFNNGYGDGMIGARPFPPYPYPPFPVDPQAQANMSLMAGLGDLKQSVAVSTANMETSQALQSSTIQSQISNAVGGILGSVSGVKDTVNGNAVALMSQINGVEKAGAANTVSLMNQIDQVSKEGAASTVTLMNQINAAEKVGTQNAVTIMQGLNGLDKGILQSQNSIERTVTNDGEKTRSLIVQQYEATLNRQLAEANAALVELRSQHALTNTARGIEVTTTNNINQAQAQQQQQAQFNALAGLVSGLANDLQYIRATNQAINVGSGTLTANPANTNTNIR